MNEGTSIFRRALRQSAALLVAALVPALLAAALHPRRPAWSLAAAAQPEVAWTEVAGWRGSALLVDARSPAAYEREHIPGALPLSEAEWEQRLPEVIKAWRPGRPVVVYCDDSDCGASEAVARRLRRELGIDQVFVLKGGWGAWLKAREP
jgi:rhodanese-related sulfurtransferase